MPLYKGGRRVRHGARGQMNPYRSYRPSRHMGRVRFTSDQVGTRARTIARRFLGTRLASAYRSYRNTQNMRPLRHQVAHSLTPSRRRTARNFGNFSGGTNRYLR